MRREKSEDNVPSAPAEKTDHVVKNVRFVRVLRYAIVLLVLWPPVAWIAARTLIVRTDLSSAGAVLVLSGSSAYVERTRRAADLFSEGRAPMIILTNDGQQGGWSQPDQRNLFFYERAARELKSAGVPAESIEILPQIVTGTYEEAVLLRGYAETHGLRSILMVTSAYHSRRALWSFRRAFEGSGIEIGIESPPLGSQNPGPAVWWLYPKGWRVIVGEYVKLVYYRLHY